MLLENKVAIVTGGARDIGKAVSLKLASEGAKVVINYFDNEAQATQTLIEIKAAGGDAIIVQGDMTKKEDVDNVVAQATEAYGDQVDILVNVAGGLVARKKIDEMDLDFFNFVIQLNLNTAFLMTQAVVPLMPKGSSIVNFASVITSYSIHYTKLYDEKKVIGPGDGFYIPPHVDHGAVCLEAGELIDVFSPIREDFFDQK